MEDRHITDLDFDKEKDASLFAIFDGHSGFEAAEFCHRHFSVQLKANKNYQQGNYEEALKENCEKMDEMMKTRKGQIELMGLKDNYDYEDNDGLQIVEIKAGCTANIALFVKGELYVANVGDSRSVLCIGGQPFPMSVDHKPMQNSEKTRILRGGGSITQGRINGDLNVSRALGDIHMKSNNNLKYSEQLVTGVPDIRHKKINSSDEFLLMGCDGIWECMTNLQLMTYIKDKLPLGKKQTIASIIEGLLDIIIAPNTKDQIYGLDNMSIILIIIKH